MVNRVVNAIDSMEWPIKDVPIVHTWLPFFVSFLTKFFLMKFSLVIVCAMFNALDAQLAFLTSEFHWDFAESFTERFFESFKLTASDQLNKNSWEIGRLLAIIGECIYGFHSVAVNSVVNSLANSVANSAANSLTNWVTQLLTVGFKAPSDAFIWLFIRGQISWKSRPFCWRNRLLVVPDQQSVVRRSDWAHKLCKNIHPHFVFRFILTTTQNKTTNGRSPFLLATSSWSAHA